ncbi:MAG: tRNA lysidine(34) synthetase TilS [Thiotrichales bacterium]|jgi:tRNA(Ile)-lysidine synthase|nr:tRNA lysidine(34) synthetase TilS [Thiotrichales bacterium]
MTTPNIASACPIEQAVSFLLAEYPSQLFVVGYSGGMDSTVLLHALRKRTDRLLAVHVHHGLQKAADAWVEHCFAQAKKMVIPFIAERVSLSNQTRRGVEDKAREARYSALWQHVKDDAILLTAHHQRDQAETLLMRLIRGAGVKGLGAMKFSQVSSQGCHVRPFLSIAYADIQAYALREGLEWVEDPTNHTLVALRNRVRNELLPLLASWQPAIARTLAQTALHAQEAQQLLMILGKEDWCRLAKGNMSWDILAWRALPWIRAKNALMYYLAEQAQLELNLVQWLEIEKQFYRNHALDVHPKLCLQQWCLLVSGQRGYLLSEAAMAIPQPVVWSLNKQHNEIVWGLAGLCCDTPDGIDKQLRIVCRQGGETIKVNGETKTLKKWLQEQDGVPAWQKARWPVFYDNEDNTLLGWAGMPPHWWPLSYKTPLAICIEWYC